MKKLNLIVFLFISAGINIMLSAQDFKSSADSLSPDNSIYRCELGGVNDYYNWVLVYDIEATVGILYNNIVVHDSATIVITDSLGNALADTVVLKTGMLVTVTAENGDQRVYSLWVKLLYPTIDIVNVEKFSKPVIDTSFNDWTRFDRVNIEVHADWLPAPSPEDLSVFFKSVWDTGGLYMYFNFTDDIINTSAEDNWLKDGVEVIILVSDDPEKRSTFNPWWQPEARTWEQKYTLTYGMTEWDVLWPYRDLTGCQFAWAEKDNGTGWEIEVFWTWTALNGNGGIYEFIPGTGKRITVAMAVNDADEMAEREHILYWWQEICACTDAEGYAMFRLAGPVTGNLEKTIPSLAVYPNPAGDMLFFDNNKPITRIQIYNILGHLAGTYQHIHDHSINVSNLPAGLYLVRVTANNGIHKTTRFIKN